ncbi:MAG: hypothetical protein PXY39_13375 [archaeon]|nr:hypothetical protein [archaeon]
MASSCFRIVAISTIVAALIFVSLTGSYPSSSAASSSDFNAANTAIQSAYTSVYHSEVQNHADVSNLVNQLNNATQYVNKAYAENSTNPAQATSDLLTAESIAQNVSNQVPSVSSAGINVHALQTFESIGVAVTVVSSAGLIYIFSDTLYREWWVRTYRSYIVKLKNKNAK